MVKKWKKVKCRKPHFCRACGRKILKGEFAYRVIVFSIGHQRYPFTEYYCYSPDISIYDVICWELHEIKENICDKISRRG